ncbi:MAG: thiamine phosphate synthase, partial [Planctomycetota bacterium]
AAFERAALAATGPSVGFSAHAGDLPAARTGADFLLLAPVFPTASHPDPSRPDHRTPLGLQGLARELSRDATPTWALGGIEPTNAAAVIGTGVRGVAVRGAILGHQEPDRVARATGSLLEAVGAAP